MRTFRDQPADGVEVLERAVQHQTSHPLQTGKLEQAPNLFHRRDGISTVAIDVAPILDYRLEAKRLDRCEFEQFRRVPEKMFQDVVGRQPRAVQQAAMVNIAARIIRVVIRDERLGDRADKGRDRRSG